MDISWKILAPTLPPTILYREQLTRSLGETFGANTNAYKPSPYRLVLLCAPAGYGKTTLLVTTIQQLALPCCWMMLDRSDQHPSTFLTTLLASIHQQFPNAGGHLDALLKGGEIQNEALSANILDTLIESLITDITDHWVLALCNYQEVNDNPLIKNLVNQLLKHLPPRCVLVIESRALPNLELASLIAHRQMFGLGSESLRFSTQEVYTLAQIQGLPSFSEENAEQLVTTFDGWITGMLLASRLGVASFEALPSARAHTPMALFTDRRHLLAFVVTEVFHDETAIYALLKETSFLEHLAPAFCDALLDTLNAAALLERAERQGLFVTCTFVDGTRIYHCHPAIRDLFREELRQHKSDAACSLHHRIAALYYQAHDYQAALSHALEANAYDLMVKILLEASQPLLEQGQSELVLRGLDSLPPQAMERHPRLLLTQVNTYLRRGDVANTRRRFEQAQHLVTALANAEQPLIRAELAIVQGKIFLQQGDYRLAQENFQEALDWLPINEQRLRLLAHQHCGICSILSSRPLHEGIAHFQKALQLCHTQHEAELTGELHHQLATAYMWAGNYPLAEHHRHAIRILQDRLGQPHKIINNLIGLGLLKMRQGLLGEAEVSFQKTLDLTQQVPRFLSSRAYALVGFGELALIRQNAPQALIYLHEALVLASQLEDRYLLNDIFGMLALTYLQLGEQYTAQSLLDQMVLQAQETQSYENIFQQLVRGTILLAAQFYDDAAKVLEQVVSLTHEKGIQWLQVQALLRLAACRLAQDQTALAKNTLQYIHNLNTQGIHEFCIQVELQIYPLLRPLLQEKDTQEDHSEISVLPVERLHIHALGEPQVHLDDKLITGWRRARALELFFLLLESKRPLHKDKIIATLWPEAEENEILNQTFRSTVYCVRQVLSNLCLVYQSGLYRLELQKAYNSIWYDVFAFEEYEQIAKTALKEEDDQQAELAYQHMVDLYRGQYVETFDSDWCRSRRDTLHQSVMEAHQQLALIAWRREAWEKSLYHWQHLLTLDPCLETAHYGAMRCFQRQGKRDLALRQYQRCRQELHEQLGTEPGSSIQKFYKYLVSP